MWWGQHKKEKREGWAEWELLKNCSVFEEEHESEL